MMTFFCFFLFYREFGKWCLMLKVTPGKVVRCFYMTVTVNGGG